jgi:iron complex outermembrane receptor protein
VAVERSIETLRAGARALACVVAASSLTAAPAAYGQQALPSPEGPSSLPTARDAVGPERAGSGGLTPGGAAFGEATSGGAASGGPASGVSRRAPREAPGASSAEQGVQIRATSAPPTRSASDVGITIGRLREVPRANAADLLRLAPGIFLTGGLGEGHAEQVFLRGFDARLGQDVEFSVEGVPLNEPGHPHGHGYADTHGVIPELVDGLRVLEGPFDPRQGDFAVAGSAQYALRARDRGARAQYRVGTFGTHRLVGVFAPEGELSGTFLGAELARSDGYGSNRAFERATVNAGYERRLEGATARVLAMSYLTRYGSAGVIREDDLRAGRIGFFDTYDATQGGDVTRHALSATLEARAFGATAWAAYRTFRFRENFTGFLLDTQRPGQSAHGQRGDAIEQVSSSMDVGARGHAKMRATFAGLPQTLELGFTGRFVRADVTQRRVRAGTHIPYATDHDFVPALANVGVYLDADLKLARWLSLRGGLRVDGFHYDVLDRCATRGTYVRGGRLDVECPDADRSGYRNPETRRSAAGMLAQPRISALVGPFSGVHLALAYGTGARSADSTYLGDGERAPFSPIQAGEAGMIFHRERGGWTLVARALGFITHVERDLIFDEAQGRNALAGGTTRYGGLGAARASHRWLDVAMHVTYARATYDQDGLLVPYVPPLVARLDAVVTAPLPVKILERPLTASLGTGWSFVAARPLPLSEWAEPILTGDLQASLRWQHVEVGLWCTNVLDARYAWSQYNYVSDFQSLDFPTRVASRHFTAAAPRNVSLMLTVHLGAAASRHGVGVAPTEAR